MKKLTKLFAGLLLLGALVVPAKAENLRDLQYDLLAANYAAEYVASNNTEMIKIEYVGSSTEAVVSVRNTEISAYAPAGTLDTGFGVAGYYQFANPLYDTIGEVCDAIELLADYKCTMLAAITDDAPKFLRDQLWTASGDLKAVGGLRLKSDTGGSDDISDTFTFFERVGITPLKGRRVLLKECKMSSNGTDALKAFGKLRRFEGSVDRVTRNDSTIVWAEGTVDETTKTVTWTDANGRGGLLFGKGEHVVAGIDNDGTSQQFATNAIECRWEER